MPSKKDLAFQADVLERLHKLEEVNAVLKQDACTLQLKLESISDEKETESQQLEHISAQLAEITTSHSAVKYMWDSMPTMMAEMRQKHDVLASSIDSMRGILNAVKSEQEREERDAIYEIERERNDAVGVLRDYIKASQEEMKSIQDCFDNAMKTLRPIPEYADLCRHCHYRWWEHARHWDKSGLPYTQGWCEPDQQRWSPGGNRRTRNRCVNCDVPWDNPLRFSRASLQNLYSRSRAW